MATSTEAIVGEVAIPSAVKVTREGSFIAVKGKLGTVKKDFLRVPATITIEGDSGSVHTFLALHVIGMEPV